MSIVPDHDQAVVAPTHNLAPRIHLGPYLPCLISRPYKLSLSKLKRSLLRTLFTTPSLKNRSSPVSVLPPTYHLSTPPTSRYPSLLLSLPRLCAALAVAAGTGLAGLPLAAAAEECIGLGLTTVLVCVVVVVVVWAVAPPEGEDCAGAVLGDVAEEMALDVGFEKFVDEVF